MLQTKRQQRRKRDKLKASLPPARTALMPLSNPALAFSNEQRAELKKLSRQRRTKTKFPRNFRDIVYATIVGAGQRGNTALAAAFGVRQQTWKEWLATEPDLVQAIADADANLRAIVISPLFQAAKGGDLEAARWFAERSWPDEFGSRATPNQINVGVQVNAPPAVPPSMSADEYLKLLAAVNAPAALPAPKPATVQPLPATPVEVPRGV